MYIDGPFFHTSIGLFIYKALFLKSYLCTQIFHVGPKLAEQIIALMEKGQMGIHKGQHLEGKKKRRYLKKAQRLSDIA